MHLDKGSFLTLDLEDFSHDLSRSLKLKNLKTRFPAIKKATDRFLDIVATQKGSKNSTVFTTAQVARDHPELIYNLSSQGNEIGCHGFFHDNIFSMEKGEFGKSLDLAIDVISKASEQEVLGFRAPKFSIRPNDIWAYEEISKRFKYDSSYIKSEDDINPNQSFEMNFENSKLIELPVFSSKILNFFPFKIIGGTYLKLLPLQRILKEMSKLSTKKIIPIIYIHPYELLWEDEFWLSQKDLKEIDLVKNLYWQIRQNQWLKFGNKSLVRKLKIILEVFPNLGNLKDSSFV